MPAQNACASPPTEIRRRSLYAGPAAAPSQGRHAALRWTCEPGLHRVAPLGRFLEPRTPQKPVKYVSGKRKNWRESILKNPLLSPSVDSHR
jgi:hypothetical protein